HLTLIVPIILPRLIPCPAPFPHTTLFRSAKNRHLQGSPNQEFHMTDASLGHRKPADLPERIQHYIDGAFVDSADGATFDVLDPVTNETYVGAAAGKKADIDLAVEAAQRAFTEGPWPRMLPRERSRILHKIADIVESRDQRLAELES